IIRLYVNRARSIPDALARVFCEEGFDVWQHAVAGQEGVDVTEAVDANLSCVLHQGCRFGHEMSAVFEIANKEQRGMLGIDDQIPWGHLPVETGALPQDELLEVGRPYAVTHPRWAHALLGRELVDEQIPAFLPEVSDPLF